MPIESYLIKQHINVVAGFEHALRIAMHEAYRRTSGKPQEPDIVAMLVIEGTPYIANTLRGVLNPHGLTCTVSSVFCHQRPEVKVGALGRCELGDLLLVHRHTDHTLQRTRSASLLLQAKLSNDAKYKVPSNEKVQLQLYQTWPVFTYVRSGSYLNGLSRNVMPKLRHSGAQYLLIDDGTGGLQHSGMLGWPNTYCMAVYPATDTLYSCFPFSEELFRFVLGLTGRGFSDDVSQDPSGWSQVVWDIMGHSLRHAFNRKQGGLRNQSRAGGDPWMSALFLTNFCTAGDGVATDPGSERESLDALFSRTLRRYRQRDGEPPNIAPPQEYEPDDDEPGLAVIVIETGEGG